MGRPRSRVRIAEAGNTLNGYPLRLLRHRGFKVFYPPRVATDSYDGVDVVALHPNGTCLIASNCLGLLGLLSILDHLGDEWYTAPKISWPEGERRGSFPFDFSPEILGELDDDELEENIEAFALLCQSAHPEIARPTNRDELVAASKRFIELDIQLERSHQED